MKYHVTARDKDAPAASPRRRIADVADISTGLALIRGLLPEKKFKAFHVWRDAVRGKKPAAAEIEATCLVNLETGSWVMDHGEKVIASGVL